MERPGWPGIFWRGPVRVVGLSKICSRQQGFLLPISVNQETEKRVSKWRCRSNHVRKNCRKDPQQILLTHLLGSWLFKICYGLLSLLFTTIYSLKFCFVKQKIDGRTTNDHVMPGDHVFLNFLGKNEKWKSETWFLKIHGTMKIPDRPAILEKNLSAL